MAKLGDCDSEACIEAEDAESAGEEAAALPDATDCADCGLSPGIWEVDRAGLVCGPCSRVWPERRLASR